MKKLCAQIFLVLTFLLMQLSLVSDEKAKATVLFATYTTVQDGASEYQQILQPLLSRQTKKSDMFTVLISSQQIKPEESVAKQKEELASLNKRHPAAYIVYGSVSLDPEKGLVTILPRIFDSSNKTIHSLEPVVSETGARFVNGCDNVSNSIYARIIELETGLESKKNSSKTENLSPETPNS